MKWWPVAIIVVLVVALIGESYFLYSIAFDFRPQPDIGFTGPTKDKKIWNCVYKHDDLNLYVRLQADGTHLNAYHGQHKVIQLLLKDDNDLLIGTHFTSWNSPIDGPNISATLTEVNKRSGEFVETEVFWSQGRRLDVPAATRGSCYQE